MTPPGPQVRKWYQSLNAEDARRMTTAVGGGIVLAVMTGPDGSLTQPLYGFQQSVLTPHVIGYLLFGLVIGCLLTYRAKVKDGTWRRVRTAPKRTLVERMTSIKLVLQRVTLAGTGLLSAVFAIIVADFTGPVARNKMSWHVLGQQFL